MQRISIFLTSLLMLYTISVFGQDDNRKTYFPAWTFHQENITINGISAGILTLNTEPKYTNTNGVKLELLGAGLLMLLAPKSMVVETEDAFLKVKQEPLSEKINGLNLSASGTFCHCLVNGLTAGLMTQTLFQVNGVSLSAFGNMAQVHNGLMVAYFNEAYIMNGVQLSAIRSSAVEMTGVQIGLINKSKRLKGIQIGLWNINQKRRFPIINWNFKED